MNNDLISRSELTDLILDSKPDDLQQSDINFLTGDIKVSLKFILNIIDNAPAVSSEITEKQAILLLINNGWLVNHDKELREKWENKPLNWLDRCDDDHLSDN